MRSLNATRLIWVLLAIICGAHAQTPEVAYTRRGVLYLTAASGRVIRTVKSRIPIGQFTISPDTTHVVFRPVGGGYGGPLYLLEVSSGKVERLTKHCPKTSDCAGHVYADPDYAPNANEVVFAVHGAAHGDLFEASGPLAVIDLTNRRIRTLQSTSNVNGQGPAFANDPHWSDDSKQVLLSFETGAAITDAAGHKLTDISDLLSTDGWSNAIGWFGSDCVLYVAGKDAKNAVDSPARILNLKTKKTEDFSTILGLPARSLRAVLVASPSIRVRREGQQMYDVHKPHTKAEGVQSYSRILQELATVTCMHACSLRLRQCAHRSRRDSAIHK